MIIQIIIAILSFMFGFFIQNILRGMASQKGNKQVKPLSRMTPKERKKAMKDLKIK